MGRLRPGTDVLGVDLRAVLAVVGSSFLIDHKLAALAAHRSGPVIAFMRVQGIVMIFLAKLLSIAEEVSVGVLLLRLRRVAPLAAGVVDLAAVLLLTLGGVGAGATVAAGGGGSPLLVCFSLSLVQNFSKVLEAFLLHADEVAGHWGSVGRVVVLNIELLAVELLRGWLHAVDLGLAVDLQLHVRFALLLILALWLLVRNTVVRVGMLLLSSLLLNLLHVQLLLLELVVLLKGGLLRLGGLMDWLAVVCRFVSARLRPSLFVGGLGVVGAVDHSLRVLPTLLTSLEVELLGLRANLVIDTDFL